MSSKIHHWKNHDDDFTVPWKQVRVAQSARELDTRREVVGSILFFSFFFTSRMRSAWKEAHFILMTSFLASTTWVMMPKSITLNSILEFFWSLTSGHDSSLAEKSLGELGPHGSRGFSPVGGNRLNSDGEPVQVLSRKGKEDCPELLTVLAVILKENYLLNPWRISSDPFWGVPVFLGQNLSWGLTVPRTGETPLRWGYQTEIWCARHRRVTLPFHGAGSLGQNALEGTTCGKRGKAREQKQQQKESRK